MAQDFVYFDLETQRSAGDVGGWEHKDKMGMSIGVTYSTRHDRYTIYREKEALALIDQLTKADLVVGFNHIGFDYAVLAPYDSWDIKPRTVSFDLLIDLEKRLGYRPKLEDVATATLGTGKTAHGLEAIKWWREGKILEIAEYCCHDVKATCLLHYYGINHGFVKYVDRFGRPQSIAVDWKGPK